MTDIKDTIADAYEGDDLLFADGMDDAIAGVVHHFNGISVVYDLHKVIELLMAQGMEYDEAEEWCSFNMIGGYVGSSTPMYIVPTAKIKEMYGD